MKRLPAVALILVTLALGASRASAQTYDLQFVLAQNDGAVYAVTAQIRSNVSTFGMGIANLVFTYDSSAIGTPCSIPRSSSTPDSTTQSRSPRRRRTGSR